MFYLFHCPYCLCLIQFWTEQGSSTTVQLYILVINGMLIVYFWFVFAWIDLSCVKNLVFLLPNLTRHNFLLSPTDSMLTEILHYQICLSSSYTSVENPPSLDLETRVFPHGMNTKVYSYFALFAFKIKFNSGRVFFPLHGI